MSQSSKQKIYRRQLAAMTPKDFRPCPVCGEQINMDIATAHGYGETIWTRTSFGDLSIPRYSQTSYPCGCKLDYDRLENKVVRETKRGEP